MLLAGGAFVIAGIIQMQLDNTLPIPPPKMTAELRVFNTLPCPVNVTLFNGSMDLPENMKSIEIMEMAEFPVKGFHGFIPGNRSTFQLRVMAATADCQLSAEPESSIFRNVTLGEEQIHSLFLSPFQGKLGTKMVLEKKEKPKKGAGFVRFVVPFRLNTTSGGGHCAALDLGVTVAEQSVVAEQGKYEIYVSDDTSVNGYRRVGRERFEVPNGGVYTLILRGNIHADTPWTRHDIVAPSSLSVFWQLPQYFVITLAEVLFSVSGLAFAYSQSPASMKAVLQAGWLMTTAFGNVIVIIISGGQLVKDQATEFFVFAALIAAFAVLFAIMTRFYTYVEQPKPAGSDDAKKDIPITKEEIDEAVDK
ncbi:putative Solute carrier family 15 member 1 [Hypsibius exemplaris]|uniref:Solute carrier family 15 member 1 n=1 Tax=Hypsibius exemplaris TaxID=2072580 RepID=A0A1W0WIW5_HYPEX|nr:putative Solute carrier family 15 member 1 [Hypsibius exemplaris]